AYQPLLQSLPTRRSSDLSAHGGEARGGIFRRHPQFVLLPLWEKGEKESPIRLNRLKSPAACGRIFLGRSAVWHRLIGRLADCDRSEEHTSELQSRENRVC